MIGLCEAGPFIVTHATIGADATLLWPQTRNLLGLQGRHPLGVGSKSCIEPCNVHDLIKGLTEDHDCGSSSIMEICCKPN